MIQSTHKQSTNQGALEFLSQAQLETSAMEETTWDSLLDFQLEFHAQCFYLSWLLLHLPGTKRKKRFRKCKEKLMAETIKILQRIPASKETRQNGEVMRQLK